jgi:hypothetical protein
MTQRFVKAFPVQMLRRARSSFADTPIAVVPSAWVRVVIGTQKCCDYSAVFDFNRIAVFVVYDRLFEKIGGV